MNNNPWVRKGLSYTATHNWYKPGANNKMVFMGSSVYKLDFLAYHLIKWYHGEQKLIEMASKIPDWAKK